MSETKYFYLHSGPLDLQPLTLAGLLNYSSVKSPAAATQCDVVTFGFFTGIQLLVQEKQFKFSKGQMFCGSLGV